MKHLFTIILFIVFQLPTQAQLEADNWVFRQNSYVTFNGASHPSNIIPANPIPYSKSGTSSYSNRNGELLFTVVANKIYDKNFNVFPSLTSGNELTAIYPDDFNLFYTSQPNLIIPFPERDSLFIVFHINSTLQTNYVTTLYYSVVNMKLRGGLGEIEPGMKNIALLAGQQVGFHMSATYHCNKKDIWFVGHYSNSDKYFSLLVNNTGVVNSPNLFTGFMIPFIFDVVTYYHRFGCLKVSPLGDKLALAHLGLNFTELLDFNISTGLGSNVKKIITYPNASDITPPPVHYDDFGPYGVEFSPSGKFLYINSTYSVLGYGPNDCYYFQYDASLPTEATVQASQYYYGYVEDRFIGAMQLANTGKLYINARDDLVEIAKPDLQGAASQFNGIVNYANLTIPAPNLSLPNFLQSYFRYPLIATGNCQFQNMSFNIQNPVGVSAVLWDFGDPASGVNNTSTSFTPSHIFSGQGSYLVKAVLQNSNGCGADTIRKYVYAGQYGVNLGADKSFCKGDSLKLSMHIPNGRTTWSTGNTDTAIYIKQPGTYWVRVNLGDCVASDTIVITENQLPQFSLGADTIICNNASVSLASNTAFGNSSYLWSNGNTNAVNTVNAAGLHWLQITDANGCKWRDSITISFKTLPNFNLGNDTAICQKDTITLNATVAGATSYTWSTGVTTATIKAYNNTIYWCDVNKEGCVYRDSLQHTVKPLPIVNLGNDTTICEDKTYLLNVTNPNSTYLWQNGSTQPTFTVTEAGNYYVTVNRNNCVLKDTVAIQYQLRPRFTLGADRLICPGLTITLDPQLTTTGLSYLWQDGTTLTTYTATQQGLYYVAISNNCGDTRDSVAIVRGLCKVHVPTAFTPNNDGINDIFRVGGGEAVKDFRMTVFNRWGKKVFETNNIQNGWNGMFNGTAQPVGTYIFYISYTDNTTNEKLQQKGTVLLLK